MSATTYKLTSNTPVRVSEGFPIWAWTEGAEIELAVLRAE